MMVTLIRLSVVYVVLSRLQNHFIYVIMFNPGNIFMLEIVLLFYSEEIEVLRG